MNPKKKKTFYLVYVYVFGVSYSYTELLNNIPLTCGSTGGDPVLYIETDGGDLWGRLGTGEFRDGEGFQ